MYKIGKLLKTKKLNYSTSKIEKFRHSGIKKCATSFNISEYSTNMSSSVPKSQIDIIAHFAIK